VPHVPQPVPVPNIIGLPPIRNGAARAHAPALGEHTATVLHEHGYSDTEIADLATREIIGTGQ